MNEELAVKHKSAMLAMPLESGIAAIREIDDPKRVRRLYMELNLMSKAIDLAADDTAEAIRQRDETQLKLSTWSLELGAQVARLYDALPDNSGARTDLTSSLASDEVNGKAKFLDDTGVTRNTVYQYRKLVKYDSDVGELKDLVVKVAEQETKAVTLNAALKVIQAEKNEARRQEKQSKLKESTVEIDSGLWHGDMRELGARIESNSVDLILTDPPYPGEFLPLFSELSVLAARVLKPGGLCLVYSGQIFLPDVMSRLCTALDYAWTFAIRHSGGNQRIFKMNVNTAWKPVIALYKPPLSIWWDSFIDVVSGGREKDLHEWQQAESEAAYFIEHLTLPGQIVVDPFCGSGTVLKAAKDLGRQYQGIELDSEHVRQATRRLSA